MKKFEIPGFYKSGFIADLKELRRKQDKRKKDFTPTVLDLGSVEILLARHFGFCYGVENAIEVSYRAIEENPDKQIYLLSQMIHNPTVNADLLSRGVQFISDTEGNRLVDWSELKPDDVVIVPAFGTTIEIMDELKAVGVNIESYNTTCPFVEKVWTRSNAIGESGFSVIIHGKHQHEETRATFSHSSSKAPSVVVLNMEEAKLLASYVLEDKSLEDFQRDFAGKYTAGFDPKKDLLKVGVVNQTTMLATETEAIALFFKSVMLKKYGQEAIDEHFADTRDTLCYATNDNQQATLGLLEENADLVLVVGGYNSSNTSHIVEILEPKFPVFFINGAEEMISEKEIHHFNIHTHEREVSFDYLPQGAKPRIIVTSGASCPDKIVEEVIDRVLNFYGNNKTLEEAIEEVVKSFE